MLLRSMLAAMAFGNAPVAAVHALAYTIGGVFHQPHGVSIELVLPHVMRFNAPDCGPAYATLAVNAFPDIADLPEPEPERATRFAERMAALSATLPHERPHPRHPAHRVSRRRRVHAAEQPSCAIRASATPRWWSTSLVRSDSTVRSSPMKAGHYFQYFAYFVLRIAHASRWPDPRLPIRVGVVGTRRFGAISVFSRTRPSWCVTRAAPRRATVAAKARGAVDRGTGAREAVAHDRSQRLALVVG